jgi:hypothetical protein
MRISITVTIVVAIVGLLIVVLLGQIFIQPEVPLITQAFFVPETITPNADGDSDITIFTYSLSRNAQITLSFTAEDGTLYMFRQNQRRTSQDYGVEFSGVVEGYTRPGESISGQVQRRLMPDGRYTWRLHAVDMQTGAQDDRTGTLVIRDAAAQLPELINFSVVPAVFTPNQDGIADRVQISVYLEKPADLVVYLEDQDGREIHVPESQDCRKPGEPGRHCFDYDGGIDLGVEPPPDGTYMLIAEAQDREGQRVRESTTLVVQDGGDPLAEIVPQPTGVDVIFTSWPYREAYFTDVLTSGERLAEPSRLDDLGFTEITMPVGDLLVFSLVVENYGKVPIRTSGPWPGTVYQQDQIWGAMGVYEQSGSWRVGIQCATGTEPFPWRWALGDPDTLLKVEDFDTGNQYYYLPVGGRSVVWGAIRMTKLIKARNPQQCWAGLIHEDVGITVRNAHVGARDIMLIPSSDETMP